MHHKFGAQRAGPCKVLECYQNAYRLALPPKWKIHDVISIEHLEPCKGEDPYEREQHWPDVEPTDQQHHLWSTLEAIVQKRISPKQKRVTYLLRQRGMGPAWNEWHTAKDVQANRPDLLEQFNGEQVGKKGVRQEEKDHRD
ncbi:hypothetical protein N7540_001170 [Penicillium herquei]|nr:hypothetical protein N7540_001170 [Penicillium herquei]